MHLSRVHTTTIVHPTNEELRWQFLVIPASSMPDPHLHIDPSLLEESGFNVIHSIVKASSLPFLVAAMLISQAYSEEGEQILQRAESYTSDWSLTEDIPERETFEFAEQVVFRDLVPFERSPLAAESLTGIVASAADKLGNKGAMLAEYEGDSFVFAANTDGIVVGSGRPQALNETIWDWIIRWITGG